MTRLIAFGAPPEDDEHANCPAGYICRVTNCERDVCPRCEPSPLEADEICADCAWNGDDAA